MKRYLVNATCVILADSPGEARAAVCTALAHGDAPTFESAHVDHGIDAATVNTPEYVQRWSDRTFADELAAAREKNKNGGDHVAMQWLATLVREDTRRKNTPSLKLETP